MLCSEVMTAAPTSVVVNFGENIQTTNGSFGLTVSKSTASGNGEQGIVLQGSSALIKANHANGNGFAGGVNDVDGSGIYASGFTIAPVGTNTVNANDDFVQECKPSTLC